MEELRMSAKERVRLEALCRVKRGELSMTGAAALIDLSLRQFRRVWKRFKNEGDAGLVHQLRGRASNRQLPQEMRDLVVKRHQERYADFGPTLACEKLAEEGLLLSPDTLTGLLKSRGLWQRQRRRGRHRKCRERRASLGSLVQMDGSHHDWFEGRCGKCVLMVMIDDATSLTYARLYPAETTEAAFDVFGRWVNRQGLPRSLYVDRHSIYRDETHPDRPTQFGRAMKDLSVELIQAHSPQAKGRVERRNAVFQDRLVKEMRLRKINTMAAGNLFLEGMFLEELNRRYAVAARVDQDLHRRLDSGTVLEEVLCVRERRVVGMDWCVRWRNRWLQIDARHASLNLPRREVLVKQRADGQLVVEHKQERLVHRELKAKPVPPRVKRAAINNRGWKPAANHPWNCESARKADPQVSLAPAAPPRDLPAGKRKKAG
jgi:transposase